MPSSGDTKSVEAPENLVSEGILTLDEAAKRLHISTKTLYRAMARGEVRWVQPFRKRFVPVREVDRILASRVHGGWASGV